MPLNFPPNGVDPDPIDGSTWTDSNFTDWVYSTDAGWLRVPVAETTNDPYVNQTTLGSIQLGNPSPAMSGSDNTILGLDAAAAMTASSDNVIAGSKAAQNITASADNVVIGADAAINMAAPASNGNVIVGAAALGSLTGALNCTIVGREAVPSTDNADNEIVIGSDANGRGANTTKIGSSRTTATFLDGMLMVGSYSITDLPTSTQAGQLIWVHDAAPNPIHAYSDGSGNWRIIGTITVVNP